MKEPYKFNAEEYGFEPLSNFPELVKYDWFGSPTYIKIIEIFPVWGKS